VLIFNAFCESELSRVGSFHFKTDLHGPMFQILTIFSR